MKETSSRVRLGPEPQLGGSKVGQLPEKLCNSFLDRLNITSQTRTAPEIFDYCHEIIFCSLDDVAKIMAGSENDEHYQSR